MHWTHFESFRLHCKHIYHPHMCAALNVTSKQGLYLLKFSMHCFKCHQPTPSSLEESTSPHLIAPNTLCLDSNAMRYPSSKIKSECANSASAGMHQFTSDNTCTGVWLHILNSHLSLRTLRSYRGTFQYLRQRPLTQTPKQQHSNPLCLSTWLQSILKFPYWTP